MIEAAYGPARKLPTSMTRTPDIGSSPPAGAGPLRDSVPARLPGGASGSVEGAGSFSCACMTCIRFRSARFCRCLSDIISSICDGDEQTLLYIPDLGTLAWYEDASKICLPLPPCPRAVIITGRARSVATRRGAITAVRAADVAGENVMNRILEGLRIVEGSAFVAAPLCGMTLAQQGADVIRFDPLQGGARRASLAAHRPWPEPVLGRAQQGQALARR